MRIGMCRLRRVCRFVTECTAETIVLRLWTGKEYRSNWIMCPHLFWTKSDQDASSEIGDDSDVTYHKSSWLCSWNFVRVKVAASTVPERTTARLALRHASSYGTGLADRCPGIGWVWEWGGGECQENKTTTSPPPPLPHTA
ncbi:hypothetical protein EVAR_62021_1 [Eumeta japonica]|uniref:Uncharacterized protein n=1 Tax=Eumeta variegata TaxID=151549 RepID=A0A4C1ZGY6_EUMVA|nr:hypothetical protein EVAR_62021_1 [Eumeta japonica]